MPGRASPPPAAGAQRRAAGITFLSSGAAFLALGLAGQTAFTAPGCALLGLGMVFLARARTAGKTIDRACPPDPRHQGEP